MKGLATLVNVFLPGIGSMMVGKVGEGVAQFMIWGIGILFCFTLIGAVVGLPMAIAGWIWAILGTAVSRRPIQVEITQRPIQQ
jgi:TM2 domain-containing membrane protein YozV